jgi:hypothetical protein
VNVPKRQARCRTSFIAEKIKPAEFEEAVRQLSKNESFLPADGLPQADKRTWLSKRVAYRKGSVEAINLSIRQNFSDSERVRHARLFIVALAGQ